MGRISMTQEEKCDDSETLVVKRKGGGNITDNRPLFSKDAKTLFIATGSIVRAYNTSTGKNVRDYEKLERKAIGIELHPNNPEILVACSENGQLVEWRWKTGHHVKQLKLNFKSHSSFDQNDCVHGFHLISTKGSSGNNSYNVLLWVMQMRNSTEILVPVMCCGHTGAAKKLDITQFTAAIHRHSIAYGICQDGEFTAAVDRQILYVHKHSNQLVKRHLIGSDRIFTCVSCHPSDEILATGDNTGRVLIWQNFWSRKPVKSVYHWHTLPVQDVAFSHAGSFFYSGGEEGVLVKWILNDTLNKGFLPRLPAPILHLLVSSSNTFVAVSTQDNGVQLLDPHNRLTSVIQHMTWGVIKASTYTLFPIGIIYDPRTKGIVLNGRCGHIQFYCPNSNTSLYNLDITGQNIVTRQRHETIVNTDVVRADVSSDGLWLATIEERNDGESSLESRLKFWYYNETSQMYKLNTSVERPHNGPVTVVKFQPISKAGPVMAVTAGCDCKFRSWSLVSANSIYTSEQLWQCESVGFFKDLTVGDLGFSSDGSLLGIAFASTLTIWVPETLELKSSLTHISIEGPINRVEFGHKNLNHIVVVACERSVAAWNLLSLSVLWVANVHVDILAADLILGHMAIFTSDRNLIVIKPDSPKPIYQQKNISPNKCSILAAIFVPRAVHCPAHPAGWLASSQLYYIDSEQELLTLDSNKSCNIDGLAILPSPESIPLTPFAALMAQQTTTSVESLKPIPHLQVGDQGAATVKEFLSAPAHTMPSLTLLCREFLHSFIATSKSHNKEDKEEHMKEVDTDEENMDICTSEMKECSLDQSEVRQDETDIDLEKRLDSVLQESMAWADRLFAK